MKTPSTAASGCETGTRAGWTQASTPPSALDRPGVLSAVTGVLGKHGISIESIVQRGRAGGEDEGVPILIVTHEATFAQMSAAVAEMDALPVVKKGSFLARMIPAPATP